MFSNICGGYPWNVLFDDSIFAFLFAINLSQLSVIVGVYQYSLLRL